VRRYSHDYPAGERVARAPTAVGLLAAGGATMNAQVLVSWSPIALMCWIAFSPVSPLDASSAPMAMKFGGWQQLNAEYESSSALRPRLEMKAL
jgi:hypothetical protein